MTMNTFLKYTLLLIASALSVPDSSAHSEVDVYLEALNGCVQQPDASLARCALATSLHTGQQAPAVYVPLDLQTGEPAGYNEGIVEQCGATKCDIYECYEDQENQMSVCDFKGSRTQDEYDSVGRL